MPILYAAIAQRSEIFAEYPEGEFPNLADLCRRIVSTVPLNEATKKKTLEADSFKFHYLSEGERVIICVAHADVKLRITFAFLESVSKEFSQNFNNPRKLLQDRMDFHNIPANDAISSVSQEIDEVKGIMSDNISKVLHKGELLNNVLDKSTGLRDTADGFLKSARQIKRNFCLQHYKLVALVVGIVIIILIIILFVACNPNFSKCKSKS